MYEQLGGEAAVDAVGNVLFDKVLLDFRVRTVLVQKEMGDSHVDAGLEAIGPAGLGESENRKGAPAPGNIPWLTVLAGVLAALAQVALLFDHLNY